MRRQKVRLVTGPVTKGAMQWQHLSDYVKARINENPWEQGRTQGDARLQALYKGYFTVRQPNDGMLEIWVSSPEPGLRNGCSLLGPVSYRNDPNPGIIDERALVILRKMDPERGLSNEALQKESEALMNRMQTNEDDKALLAEALRRDRFNSLITDPRFEADKMRHIAPVTVGATLTH